MERRDWLLLAIGDRMEPIQVQKTLFKFAVEGGVPESQAYAFEPYNWGPCSFQIYEDLEELVCSGLVEAVPSGRGWSSYRAAPKGRAMIDQLRKGAEPPLLKKLDAARDYVVTRDFVTLLRDVYQDYPKFATKSLFRG
jgi:uncharacterized protein YwgA